jgi:phosphoglycerate dehydrogenase-like enzyme
VTIRIAVGSRPRPGPGRTAPAGAGEAAGDDVDWAVEAVRKGGGEPVAVGESAAGLVWLPPGRPDGLAEVLAAQPELRWVQLPYAGVEAVAAAGGLHPERTWTCAKGSYAEPVAEHALLLAQAGLRLLPERLRARTWGRAAGTSLYDRRVTILGGGGITGELLRLLAPYRVEATVVRRRPDPVPGAARTVPTEALPSVLPGALVVFVALALTPETIGIIGAPELNAMDPTAFLVNVARGRHVDTEALADALAGGTIAGAGLDVTEPEPLPDGHRLWDEPRCIITPHTADTWDMIKPLLARRITANVAHFTAGEPLEGLVDPTSGY